MTAANSDQLIAFGRATVERLSAAIEGGANLLHCQLVACAFYEAVMRAWSDTPTHEFVRAGLLGAAAAQLRYAADRSPSPARMLDGIRSALAMMEASAETPDPAQARASFRVIDGGLSRPSRALSA